MRLTLLVAIHCLAGILASAQPREGADAAGWTFLPAGLLFTPLAANYEEPRTGVRKEIGSSQLKLDIGSSIDVVEYQFSSPGSRMRMGIEFFTYALSTSADGLRLQIDAVDGYFGGHVTFESRAERTRLALRLRLMHLSSHLIDGHWDAATKQWKNGKEPIPYTRDFGELLGSWTWSWEPVALTVYAGISYSTLVRPDDLARFGSLQGMELRTTGLIGPVFGKPCCIYLADHLAVTGIPTYYGTNNLEGGVKFGSWEGMGIRLYANYYSGLEVFHQYYYVRRDLWGAGVAFDFW